MSAQPYPRGSDWRRWDLHVHTPESFENDFGGWDRYVPALESIEGVSVLGVTDYFFIDGYRKILELRRDGKLRNFDLVLPNIELRLGTFVPKRSDGSQLRRLNFHVLFSNELSPDVIEQQFLHDLHFEIEGSTESDRGKRNLTRAAVEEAGALVKKYQTTFAQDSDFVVGCKVITFDLQEARRVLQKDCFSGRYLLFLASENWDQIAWGGQDYLVRKNLLQSAHGLFCGQAGTIEWCLGRRGDMSSEAFVNEFGVLKPCIHGSDAHSIATICVPEDEKFCWIKADPTFEGLKQLVYEPSSRVYVGLTPPVYHDEARVIRSVTLSHADGWFDEVEIPLNAGLVSIIGQKGSGKSALAELIAYAAGSWNTTESGSFIRRAGSHLQKLSVQLHWSDGELTEQRLGDAQAEEQRVRYLSQKFVERLCADDRIGAELIREIESVIFAYTDPTETLNASNFEELRALRTEGIRTERDRLRGEMTELIREECALRANYAKLPEKKARIKSLKEEAKGLAKQIPKPASDAEKKVQEELQKKRDALITAQQEVAALKQKLQKIADIRSRLTALSSQMIRSYADIGVVLVDVGIPESDLPAFKPIFAGDTETPLAKRTAALTAAIATKEGAEESPADGTIRALERAIKVLAERESADKTRQAKIKTIQTRLAAIGVEVKRLEGEIAQIEGPDLAKLKTARQDRLKAYADYFENLGLERKALEELYLPVKQKLTDAAGSGQAQELEFSIRWEVSVEEWLERGSRLFDQRKDNPFGKMQDLTKAAKEILVPGWVRGEPEAVKEAFTAFTEQFLKMHPREYMRSEVTIQDVLEWLYEVDHVRLNYGLKFNGVELEKLSPGTKGIVLLILYLGMDTADTRPLIVDQPDENLDNESIYQLLTAYFKNAKARRQVILITHNPNLVVNADSEQLVIATCTRRDTGLPYITYQMGALESDVPREASVRDRACRILEGGKEAFMRRESRYAISRPG